MLSAVQLQDSVSVIKDGGDESSDSEVINKASLSIIIILGTWCHRVMMLF